MATKEKAETKKTETKKAEKPIMLGTTEVAKLHKIDGKKLRMILRKNNVEKEEGRYAWKPDSQFVNKTLPKLIEEYGKQEEKAKAAKAEKPAAKKAEKKAAGKKAAKKAPAESGDDEVSEDEVEELE